jgi:hypothetical protein
MPFARLFPFDIIEPQLNDATFCKPWGLNFAFLILACGGSRKRAADLAGWL